MSKIKSNNCICEKAVRYTYYNLLRKNYNSGDAIKSAGIVLKYHHPELSDDKITQKLFNILIK